MLISPCSPLLALDRHSLSLVLQHLPWRDKLLQLARLCHALPAIQPADFSCAQVLLERDQREGAGDFTDYGHSCFSVRAMTQFLTQYPALDRFTLREVRMDLPPPIELAGGRRVWLDHNYS